MKIAVLMGGKSSEAEVSRKSGNAIAKALQQIEHEVTELEWNEADVIRNIEELYRYDVIFIAYHGGAGEDGKVQAVLQLAGIPFTGSRYVASGIAMNKVLSKMLFENEGIPTPPWIETKPDIDNSSLLLSIVQNGFSLPAVVKPISEGSTVGVTIAVSEKELLDGVELASKHGEVMVEQYIPGKEVTVSILEGIALPVIEIIPEDGFYDYEHKYTAGKSRYVCPAGIPGQIAEKLQRYAVGAYKAIGCRHYARVDFRINEANDIFCLEVNTLPGMTGLSLVPMAAKAIGIEFPELVNKIACITYESKEE